MTNANARRRTDVVPSLEAWFDYGEAMRLVLPLPPNLTNVASRASRSRWAQQRAKKDYWGLLNALHAAKQFPPAPESPPCPAKLSVTLYLWGPMDDDNAMARTKWVVDWLVGWGYLRGDSRKLLKRELPVQVIDRKQQRIELEIEVCE